MSAGAWGPASPEPSGAAAENKDKEKPTAAAATRDSAAAVDLAPPASGGATADTDDSLAAQAARACAERSATSAAEGSVVNTVRDSTRYIRVHPSRTANARYFLFKYADASPAAPQWYGTFKARLAVLQNNGTKPDGQLVFALLTTNYSEGQPKAWELSFCYDNIEVLVALFDPSHTKVHMVGLKDTARHRLR